MEIIKNEESKKIFNKLSKEVNNLLKNINLEIDNKFINPFWENNRLSIRNLISNNFDENFLNEGNIKSTMFLENIEITNKEIPYVGIENLRNIKEYNFSNQNLNVENFKISSNTVHHLNHIHTLKNNSHGYEKINSVLEWGGGYGNMCKLLLEDNKNIKKYTLIDIPEFCIIQYVYLSSYFGEDKVRIVKNNEDILEEGINIIPINYLDKLKIRKHDLFASTWAITESTFNSQDLAISKGFFEYEYILIAFHQCGIHIPFMEESTRIREILTKKGINIHLIDFIPGINYYAIK